MDENQDNRDALLEEAATIRNQAQRFQQAATIVHDDLVAAALRARALELEDAAARLEDQASKARK